jgi:hypothetical protein
MTSEPPPPRIGNMTCIAPATPAAESAGSGGAANSRLAMGGSAKRIRAGRWIKRWVMASPPSLDG